MFAKNTLMIKQRIDSVNLVRPLLMLSVILEVIFLIVRKNDEQPHFIDQRGIRQEDKMWSFDKVPAIVLFSNK